MTLFNALRDLADGLTRGLGLFLTERRDLTIAPGLHNRRR